MLAQPLTPTGCACDKRRCRPGMDKPGAEVGRAGLAVLPARRRQKDQRWMSLMASTTIEDPTAISRMSPATRTYLCIGGGGGSCTSIGWGTG
jgi:hypothetical protein